MQQFIFESLLLHIFWKNILIIHLAMSYFGDFCTLWLLRASFSHRFNNLQTFKYLTTYQMFLF